MAGRLHEVPRPRQRGFVPKDEQGRTLAEGKAKIGVATNNVAEYKALLAGLQAAGDLGVRKLLVRTDSDLVVNHMRGDWRAYDPAVSSSPTVRPARVEDVAQMARVNVRCWQETYRGLMSDAVLDDPGFLTVRERFWTAALTDERYRENRVAVAERDDQLVGIAMSGPPLDAAAAWARQLYVLYVYAADHGTGAGSALLEAVVDPEESAALWVADPNPRAQAFYRKHGFVADGTAQVEDGVREIRMVRGMQHGR